MRILRIPFRIIYVTYAALIFLLLMLLIFPCVVLASLLGRIRGGNIVYWLAHRWADIWLAMIGIYHQKILEQPLVPGRTYIFVFNHISYMDVPQLLKAVRQPLRVLGKIELTSIPVFGFIYNAAVVTVDRSSPAHRARSVRILKSVLSKGISVALAPEGTFNMEPIPLKQFYDGAFRIAIETQTPIKPLLFLDTYERLHYSSIFSLTPGRLRTVYLEEISPEGYTIEQLDELKQKVFKLMEQKLYAYGAAWIKS